MSTQPRRVLAIDPGPTQTAYIITTDGRPCSFDIAPNRDVCDLLGDLTGNHLTIAVEMVASYGMPVGREVFDTCLWIGRFLSAAPVDPVLVLRRDIKLHHCGSVAAKDSNITQALADRFAPGQPGHGKGTRNAPGFFYGFRADVWAAYALAVYIDDHLANGTPPATYIPLGYTTKETQA